MPSPGRRNDTPDSPSCCREKIPLNDSNSPEIGDLYGFPHVNPYEMVDFREKAQ